MMMVVVMSAAAVMIVVMVVVSAAAVMIVVMVMVMPTAAVIIIVFGDGLPAVFVEYHTDLIHNQNLLLSYPSHHGRYRQGAKHLSDSALPAFWSG